MFASTNDDAHTEHIINIIKQALQKAEIEERNPRNQLPPVHAISNIYWQEVGSGIEHWHQVDSNTYWQAPSRDIEIIIDAAQYPGDRFHTSIRLYRLAEDIKGAFPKDADSIEALADTLKFLCARMSGTLLKVRDSLEDRRINRFDKLLDRRKAPFIKLKERHKAFFKSSESSEDQAEKKLRGGWDKRGGNRRSKPAWRNKTTLKEYAQLVEDRLSLAKQIKYVFNRCDGADEWMEDLEKDRAYKLLSEGVAPEIIAWAKKQIASVYLPPEVREPQAIACEMARQELGLHKPNDIGTLQGYFRQGIGLLRSEQTRSKQ